MRSSPPPDLVAQILDATPPGARRALLLGRGDAWGGALAARGWAVTRHADLEALPFPDGAMDLVVADDVLHRTEWDRWLLQQAHRVLADGGRLIVTAPNLAAFGAPGDLAFLLGRTARELTRRARRTLGRPPERLRFTGRRYPRRSLVTMLESLGFRIERAASLDAGWLAPLGGPEALRRRHLVVAARGPSLFGLATGRPFPDPEAFRRSFEQTHRPLVEDRERWLARHPEHRHTTSRALAPEDYAGQDALVLAPHPDDDVIPCGGTVARLIGSGARVTIVQATDGSEAASLWHDAGPRRRTVRLDEAREVGRLLGAHAVECWGEDNAAFHVREPLVARLAATLAALQPRLILVPFVTDIHPDHVTLCRILAAALERNPLDSAEVLGYQTWCLVPVHTHCDVTEVMPLVERVITQYATAMKVEDYVHFAQDHDYYTAVTRGLGPRFAEAFFGVPASGFARLLATVDPPRG